MIRLALAALLAVPASAQAPGQPAPGSPERVYSLDESLRLVRNDPRLQTAEQDLIIADSRVTEARLRFLPDIGVQASATKYESRYASALSQEFRNLLLFPGAQTENLYSGRAYFNLPIYEGRRTLNTLRLAQAAQKQALSNRDSVKLDLTLAVKEAFYRLLHAQDRAAAMDDHAREAERDAQDGSLGAWERVEAEAAAAAARTRAARAAHELDGARLHFLKTLNLELGTPFRVDGRLETRPAAFDPEKAVVWAMELRPELQSQTYKAQMDAIGVNLAMGRRHPTLFVAGDYEVTDQRFPLKRNNWDVSVGLKLPFSFDYWSQLKQKKAEQRQGQLARADLQDRVRLEVRQAAETLAWWQSEWPRREARWRRVQILLDAAAGKPGAALTRLRARAGALDLRLSHLEAVTEHILARARFERAVGRELQP